MMLIFDIGSNRFAFTDACRERYSNCNIVAVDPIYEFYENYDAIKHEGRLKYLNKIVSDKSNSTETIQINIREPGMSSASSDFMNKSRFIKGNDHILTDYRKNGITFINENPDKISWLPFSPSNLVDTKTFKKAIINRFETIDGFLKTIYFENLVPRDAQTITLDKMIELYGQPDLIKIDVEGYEGTVLRGLTSKTKKLCFEWSEEFPEELNNCITILENLGYEKFGVLGYFEEGDIYEFLTYDPAGDTFLKEPDYHSADKIRADLLKCVDVHRRINWGMVWAK